ncbi:MAG: carbohydrate binding family 9 domain-containing protein [Acidobacteria bacterium]|nr:carbohydrate binding family 9 domain-containing protein [Acidobacteriota bacterium]
MTDRIMSSARSVALLGWVLLYLSASPRVQAQTDGATTGTHGRRILLAKRSELPVTVDGNLSDPAWLEGQISLDFWQQEPHEGEPSTEKTELRVLYTATTLYVGVICYDSNPAAILATERRRDNTLENDDTVSLVLDTFHDHRNAFLFRTNPMGTQYDAMITDEGKSTNANWDEEWEVAAQVNPAGWMAEFAIPFKSLRVSDSDGHLWGVDMERVIRRKNEQSYWNNYRRGFRLEDVSQAGHLEGIENIETGLRLRVKPYFLGGFSQRVRKTSPTSDTLRSTFRNASDVGMELMKYRITPSLTADLTWNMDFAQTEVDDLLINLERFPLFFPEKREFFQEGAGIFNFGSAQREGDRELVTFHSRRIGLSPLGAVIPIKGGGRLTGRLGRFTLGVLDVQTEALPSENIPASNYGVVRLKRDVLARSTVGGFLVSREKGGSADFNRVYGLDSKFVFYKYFSVDSFFARSDEPGEKDGNWLASAVAKWDSDFLIAGVEYFSLGPNFRDDLGFILRKDVRRITPNLAFRPRPNIPGIRQIELSGRWDYIMNQRNKLMERQDHYVVQVVFQSGDSFRISPLHHYFDRLEKPNEIRPGIVIPAGDYAWDLYSIRYQANPARKLSGFAWFVQRYGYYGGNYYFWRFGPVLKVTQNLSLGVDYTVNDITLPGGSFVDHIVNARVNYAFNNQWLTSTTIQYDRESSFLGFNFRLNYIFRPGDDFFLIYNETRRVGGPLEGQKDRTLQTKLTYSFDF